MSLSTHYLIVPQAHWTIVLSPIQGCQNAPVTGAIASNFEGFTSYKLLEKSVEMND